MKVGIIGAGSVGGTLGQGFSKAGHTVLFGLRDPGSAKYAELAGSGAKLVTLRAAVEEADAVVLATPWGATEDAIKGAGDFGGKPLLDATNPLGPGLSLTHGHTDSGGEQVQRWAPTAKVVKVFNTTGFDNMANPVYGETRTAMFLCGDDPAACAVAKTLASDLGFDAIEVGPLKQARLLEPVAALWITLAMVKGHGRNIAFAVLRRDGQKA